MTTFIATAQTTSAKRIKTAQRAIALFPRHWVSVGSGDQIDAWRITLCFDGPREQASQEAIAEFRKAIKEAYAR